MRISIDIEEKYESVSKGFTFVSDALMWLETVGMNMSYIEEIEKEIEIIDVE